MQSALTALKAWPEVDETQIGVMGYCFGGQAALGLARSRVDTRAAVSVHGVYDVPSEARPKMQASILILHGWADPLARAPALWGWRKS
ncbi:MAG: dienelactone hydrolase [Pseudorhodobacter sp.]|jgi:dienelactone hydrolase